MKITKYGGKEGIRRIQNSVLLRKQEEELRNSNVIIATAGCFDKCPECGEVKKLQKWEGSYAEFHGTEGIYIVKCRHFDDGRGKNKKYYTVMVYRCATCGAEWESDRWLDN